MDAVEKIAKPVHQSDFVKVIAWLGSGLVIAAIVLTGVRVLSAVLLDPRTPFTQWFSIALGEAFWVSVGGLLMLPLAVPALLAWVRVARRWKRMDTDFPVLIASLVVLAGLLALVAGMVSSWEEILPSRTGSFGTSTFNIALDILPGAAAALTLPRLLIPMLRRGTFATEA